MLSFSSIGIRVGLIIKGGAIIDHETPRERRVVAVKK
jgi:hypothetical protein